MRVKTHLQCTIITNIGLGSPKYDVYYQQFCRRLLSLSFPDCKVPTGIGCLTAWEKVKHCSYLTGVILDSHVLHGVLDSGNALDEFESVGLTSRVAIDRLGLIYQ